MSLDDELRRRLQEAADAAGAGTDAAALTQSVTRTAAVGSPRPPMRLLGAIGAAGLVAGGALGFTALQPESNSTAAAQIQVQQYSLYDCPDGGLRGTALPGDRVFVTGRNEAGDWLELRDPRNQSTRAWVPADAVDPDAVADVPVVPCNPAVELVAGVVETSTTTSTSTSTTVPETTTTIPPTTVPVTTPVTVTATVPPTVPPNVPPAVGTINASPGVIAGYFDCGVDASTISVIVTDNSGIASVRLDWSIPALPSQRTGSLLLTPSGNTYSGAITPGNADNQDRYVALTITATDSQGLTTVKQANKTLFVEYCLS